MPNMELESKFKLQKGISCRVLGHKVLLVRDLASEKCSIQYIILSAFFFLKYALHLHGAAWCCCTSSCIFARRAAKAARYAGALYWARGRNYFGEATVTERHVILALNDLSQFNHENMPNTSNCENMQSVNNNVCTYILYVCIDSHIMLSPTYTYICMYDISLTLTVVLL